MRSISERGISLITHYEGFSATPYICAGGWPTIGYGHVIGAGEHFPEPIDEQQAEALLKRDVRVAERAVARLIAAPLAQHQFDALVSFTFNLGAGALQRSTLRQKVNREEHDDVPKELMKWVFAGGRRVKGLVKRRAAEAEMYRGG